MGNVQNVQESLINDMKLSINAVNSCISYDIFMSKPTENSGHFTEFIKLRKVGNCVDYLQANLHISFEGNTKIFFVYL